MRLYVIFSFAAEKSGGSRSPDEHDDASLANGSKAENPSSNGKPGKNEASSSNGQSTTAKEHVSILTNGRPATASGGGSSSANSSRPAGGGGASSTNRRSAGGGASSAPPPAQNLPPRLQRIQSDRDRLKSGAGRC